MPATLQSPVVVATAPGVVLRTVTLNVENGSVDMAGVYVDANGNAISAAPSVSMPHAAWLAAVQAASGNLKNRLYTVYLAGAGFTASGIT